jgi:hypothetical protein
METEDDRESDDDDDVDDVDEGTPLTDVSGIDEQWPPPDPMNEVDDLPPVPPPLKRHASPSFEDVVATAPALSGPHRRRPAPHRRRALKRARAIETEGYTPRPSTIAKHVAAAVHLPLPTFNASSMPAALGAYAARVENKGERYGSKKRRTVAELIQLGFQLIPWNGLYAASPLPTLFYSLPLQ